MFPDAVVDDPAVGTDYSIALALDASGRGPRPIARLQHGERVVARSRSPRRMLRALAAHLAVHAREDRHDLLELHAVALIRDDGQVVLAPRDVVHKAAGNERKLADGGIGIVEGPLSLMEADGPRLVVEAPIGAFADGALEDVPDATDELPVPLPGRYTLAAMVVGDVPFTPDLSSPARTALALVTLARNFAVFGGQRGLELAAELATVTPVAAVEQTRAAAALRTVVDLFDPTGHRSTA